MVGARVLLLVAIAGAAERPGTCCAFVGRVGVDRPIRSLVHAKKRRRKAPSADGAAPVENAAPRDPVGPPPMPPVPESRAVEPSLVSAQPPSVASAEPPSLAPMQPPSPPRATDLPELADFEARPSPLQPAQDQVGAQNRISRADSDRFRQALELDPNADMDTNLFVERELDLTSLILAEGSRPFLGIDVAYLQTGHLILVGVALLAALVETSGLPLTDLPDVYRGFLQQGLVVVYLVNTVLVFFSIQPAQERRQPVSFWMGKVFVLGGLAYGELCSRPVPQRTAGE